MRAVLCCSFLALAALAYGGQKPQHPAKPAGKDLGSILDTVPVCGARTIVYDDGRLDWIRTPRKQDIAIRLDSFHVEHDTTLVLSAHVESDIVPLSELPRPPVALVGTVAGKCDSFLVHQQITIDTLEQFSLRLPIGKSEALCFAGLVSKVYDLSKLRGITPNKQPADSASGRAPKPRK